MADSKISALTDGGAVAPTDDIPAVRAGANVRVRAMNNTLAAANIWVGNAGNVATAVAMSGDGKIAATGALTITSLNANNISTGIVPTARLGSGTANANTVLTGGQTFTENPTVQTATALTSMSSPAFIATGVVPYTSNAVTLAGTDNGKVVTLNNANAVTLTVPNNLATGFTCTLVQLGAGNVKVSAAGNVTINSRGSANNTNGQYAVAFLTSPTANNFVFGGDIQT